MPSHKQRPLFLHLMLFPERGCSPLGERSRQLGNLTKTRDLYPDMIYTSVSFVGSTVLAEELKLLGPRYATGVIVTQVVPALGHSSLVLDYKTALGKYFPGEAPDYVSLEGYVAANVLIAALKRNDRALTPRAR